MIIINCLSAECYDLWSQSGASLRCHIGFPEASVLRFWQLVVPWVQMFASHSWHPVSLSTPPTTAASSCFKYSTPLIAPPFLSLNHLSICTSAFHWGLHVSEDLNALNAGTSTVLLWHLTQRLGDLKGRGENYRKWSVTKIKNRPRLPPITVNNAVQAICWSDGGLVLSVEK